MASRISSKSAPLQSQLPIPARWPDPNACTKPNLKFTGVTRAGSRAERTSRSKIVLEKQEKRDILDDVDFDDFDLSKFDMRHLNKATQTDMFYEPSAYSSASSNRSVKTAPEGNENDRKQERQISASTGESSDGVRYRKRMSIADDLATMARVGGNTIYNTGQRIGKV